MLLYKHDEPQYRRRYADRDHSRVLARGGQITQLPETRIPTWSEANDELVKLAWHTYVPPKPETEEDDDQC